MFGACGKKNPDHDPSDAAGLRHGSSRPAGLYLVTKKATETDKRIDTHNKKKPPQVSFLGSHACTPAPMSCFMYA